MKPSSPDTQSILKKLEHFCSYQERCHIEVDKKLADFNISFREKQEIKTILIDRGFLNEGRFAATYAGSKFRQKKWGRIKIVHELKLRKISEANIRLALREIDDEQYLQTLHQLAEKRLREIKHESILIKKKKLSDYLLYRGWERDLVYQKVNEMIKS